MFLNFFKSFIISIFVPDLLRRTLTTERRRWNLLTQNHSTKTAEIEFTEFLIVFDL